MNNVSKMNKPVVVESSSLIERHDTTEALRNLSWDLDARLAELRQDYMSKEASIRSDFLQAAIEVMNV